MAESIGEMRTLIVTEAERVNDLVGQFTALQEELNQAATGLAGRLEGSGHDEAARAVGMVAAATDANTLGIAALVESNNAAQGYVASI